MKENDGDAQLSDLMASYLKHFKATMGVKLTLLEALCLGGNSLQSNPQFLLSKFSSRSYQNEWQIDPHTLSIDIDNSIIINKFYVSIYEYLEFRLNTIMDIAEGAFQQEVQTFQKQLHRIAKKAQSADKAGLNLGQLFLQLNNLQSNFAWSLLQKIENRKINLPRVIIDYQVIEEIKAFFREKINKQQNTGLKENLKINLKNVSREHNNSLSTKNEQSLKTKAIFVRKTHLKKQYPIINSFELEPKELQIEKAHWKINISNYQNLDESGELQAYVTQTQKKKFQNIYALLDIDEISFSPRQKNQLQVELEQKNLKNKIHIETFINRYQRKLRKKGQKDSKDRSARSTAKTSKEIPSKSQEVSLFHQKFDSVQYLNPFFKNISQRFKRGDGILELPPIASKHGRRITIQK